jgi:putative glycosyltransferase (TIGR04348 family)
MKLSIVTPAGVGSRNGNRNTATRWARLLRELGHKATVEQQWRGSSVDALIALHARRSYESIRRYADAYPDRPLIVVLTGTDVYRDIRTVRKAKVSLDLSSQLVVLQDQALKELAPRHRRKTHVIYQSARAIPRPRPLSTCFEVVVSGHLRHEKDPFRAAAALQYLPRASRVRVTHVGRALTSDMAAEARAWMKREPRYRWLGEVTHARALRLLARSRLLVISSRMEGGANVVSEARAVGVPVIASRVSGNVGMLGRGYRGYYPFGDNRALARLIARAEQDDSYYRVIRDACAARSALVSPERERALLSALVEQAIRPTLGRMERPKKL